MGGLHTVSEKAFHIRRFGLLKACLNLAGEWKGVGTRTKHFPVAALAFILAAVVILNLGGLFQYPLRQL